MAKPSDSDDLLNFIDEVKKIKTEYDTIAKYTGVNFNIFNILDVSSKEVKLHSNFLAEMLNPKGSHMQGDTFLKIFLEEIEDEIKWKDGEIGDFESIKAVVNKEFWIGKTNEDYTEGGSIDILIKNNHQGIIIENKIYAGDQSNQLLRYYNYGVNTFKSKQSFRLLYLTLYGNQPSASSTSRITYYSCISYHTHIRNWLEKCLTVVYDFPLVFALIRQYLNHIKHLTNQSIFEKMNEKIKDKIKVDQVAFKAAREISNTFLITRKNLMDEIKAHFYSYLSRLQKPQCILDLKINIALSNDSPDGYWVGLSINQAQSEGLNYDLIKQIAINAGGSKGNLNYLSWYTLKCIPKILDNYLDDDLWLLLQADNLNILYNKIDEEITEFLNRVTSGYTNTI